MNECGVMTKPNVMYLRGVVKPKSKDFMWPLVTLSFEVTAVVGALRRDVPLKRCCGRARHDE